MVTNEKEINFYKRHGGGRPNRPEQPGKGLAGPGFSAGASNQISLMKWVYGVQPDEPEATASMPLLPKIALRGNFLLGIGHFISEIADCTQQQKTQVPPSPSPAAPVCSASLRHGAYKN